MSEDLNKATVANAETGEVIERELTPEELAELEASNLAYQASQAEALAKQEARTSALAKLAALGLTEEEVAAL